MDYTQWQAEQDAKRAASDRQAAERRRLVSAADRDRLPVVYATFTRCPSCGGVKHRSYRSIDQGDGSRMRWTRCHCGKTFIVILE